MTINASRPGRAAAAVAMETHGKRLIPLEAYRGIAAFIVVVHHFFLGFSPTTTGLLAETRRADSLIGQPYFAFFNGTGAVSFFFTLSGFVLCWSYFNRENPGTLLLAFLKRFPRLVGVVTLTTVLSWALFKLGLYYFNDAAKVSASPWLASFAGAGLTPEFQPTFEEAFFQGLTTFFTGKSHYNSNLWTMQLEFFGSMVVYMLASFIATVLGYRYRLYAAIILLSSALYYSQHIFPFVAGVFLSSYLAKKKVAIPTGASLLLIGAGLYLLGYMIPKKSYSWVLLLPEALPTHFHQVPMHTLGALAIIFATLANRNVFDGLSGSFFRFLGQISFPLYLVHGLVICSLSSWVYLQMMARGYDSTTTLLVVFGVTAAGSVVASLPLSRFDDWWVTQVNAVGRWAVGRDLVGHVAAPVRGGVDSKEASSAAPGHVERGANRD